MSYQQLLDKLKENADEEYRVFHKRLLKNDSINVIGVRMPTLRNIAKEYKNAVEEVLSFPDEYYEVTFVKLTAVSLLKYEDFIKYIDECVPLIDNWATCDCFKPKCIAKHRDEFLPYIKKYSKFDREYFQRFALTTLLHFYVEKEYFDEIKSIMSDINSEKYFYVHMACAWLLAEMLVKDYDDTVEYLKESLQNGTLSSKTYNKAIQKACESFRLSDERKNYLKGIKI